MSELSQAELDAIVTYRKDYDEIRAVLANGVYPNIVVAIRLFRQFEAKYAPGRPGHDARIWAHYQQLTAPIAEHIATLIEAGETIVAIMDAAEQAVPGFFGHAITPLWTPDAATPLDE